MGKENKDIVKITGNSRPKYPEQKGLISILLPVYNSEQHLSECLDSILAQSFKNWEALLVNDGSTDNTEKIVDEYAQNDSRFIALHKQNEGTLLARKTGFENSRGEFIANIDHDDIYDELFLEKMYARIIKSNSDFVWCKCQELNKSSVYHAENYKWSEDATENVASVLVPGNGVTPMTWNKLIKRIIYSKIHFPHENIVWGEDAIQSVQIAYYSKSATFVPEILYFHRPSGHSSIPNLMSEIRVMAIIKKTVLDGIFGKIIPKNVENTFCVLMSYCNTVYNFFLLDKRQRREFEKDLKPFFSQVIRCTKKMNLRICLFLANNGIEFPLLMIDKLMKPLFLKIRAILYEEVTCQD